MRFQKIFLKKTEKHDIFPSVIGNLKLRQNRKPGTGITSMKIKAITGIIAVAAVVLLLTGCVIDYRAEAADKAREYLLDNMEGLTVLQQNYIRYNNPVILNKKLWDSTVPDVMPDEHIITRHERNKYKNPNMDMMMQCFGWRVPGMNKDILVVGTAQRDFRFWEVNRIVLRSREKEDLAGMKIRSKAMNFAIIALPDLKGKIFHRVRYATPAVHKSLFILDQPKKDFSKDSWMDFLQIVKDREPIQVSAVWIDPATKKRIVVIGLSGDEELNSWYPVRLTELSEEETKTYIGSKYTVFAKDKDDPFSPDYQKEEKSEEDEE